MSYCTRCGAYIPIGDTACPACGYDPEEEKRAEEKAAEEKKKAEEKAAEEKKKAEAAAAAAAAAQSHSGSYGTQGAYQSAPHGYQSAQGAYQTQSQTGSYSSQSQSGAYQSQQSGYQSQQGAYQSQQSGYQSQQGAYQSQTGAYQSQQNGYQSQQSGYQSQNTHQTQQQTQAMTWAPWNQQNQKEDPREDAGTPLDDNDEEYIPEELRRLSVLSYIGPMFILPLLRHKNNDFVRFHANQGLSLFILENVLGWIFGGGILDAIGTIFCIYCVVLGAKNAAAGKKGELPIVGKWRILK